MVNNMKRVNNEVNQFISNFYNLNFANDTKGKEVLRKQFMAGYCYYFAHLLMTAFERGECCYCKDRGHFVWQDIDGNCWDIEGLYISDCDLIPESECDDEIINSFKHRRIK